MIKLRCAHLDLGIRRRPEPERGGGPQYVRARGRRGVAGEQWKGWWGATRRTTTRCSSSAITRASGSVWREHDVPLRHRRDRAGLVIRTEPNNGLDRRDAASRVRRATREVADAADQCS
jgi:hypothetical protein